MARHFIHETDLGQAELPGLFANALTLKRERGRGPAPLAGQSWGLLFFKKSTRTRVSFEVGVHELGGQPVVLSAEDMQLSRGESPEDTAKVLGRYLHGLVIRCHEHTLLTEFARHSGVPVVNALSDLLHPCQIFADAFTLAERLDPEQAPLEALRGKTIAFFGDTGCNVAHSWVLAAPLFGMRVLLAGPREALPDAETRLLLEQAGLEPTWQQVDDPGEAAREADVLYTDVWVSMGKEDEAEARRKRFQPFQVTTDLLDAAPEGAVFLHCLPAKVGLEVGPGVLEHPRSAVFDQAENRLHMQKAILAHLVS